MMIARLRSERFVRTALLLAAALSVGGSLGLHAEPASSPVALAGTFTAALAPAAPHTTSAPHACPLCLLYDSASPARGASVVQGIPHAVPRAVTGRTTPKLKLLALVYGGRAPPSLL
jgi:hypothetical protein